MIKVQPASYCRRCFLPVFTWNTKQMKMCILDRGQRFWFSISLAVKLGCDAWKKDLPISQLFVGDIPWMSALREHYVLWEIGHIFWRGFYECSLPLVVIWTAQVFAENVSSTLDVVGITKVLSASYCRRCFLPLFTLSTTLMKMRILDRGQRCWFSISLAVKLDCKAELWWPA